MTAPGIAAPLLIRARGPSPTSGGQPANTGFGFEAAVARAPARWNLHWPLVLTASLGLVLTAGTNAKDAAPADRMGVNDPAAPGGMMVDSPVTFPKSGPLPPKFVPDITQADEPVEKDFFLFRSPCRSLQQIAAIQKAMPPGTFTPPAPDWTSLRKTRRLLTEGGTLRILGLGDSIVNDTMRSGWVASLGAAYPKAKIEATVYVRGGGGCQHYRDENRVTTYIVPRKPDLVLIGGISQRDTYSIAVVIDQIRAALPEVEILLMTGAFGTADPRDVGALTAAPHSGTGPYGEALRRLARDKRCAYLDVTGPWAEYIRSSKLHPHLFYRDRTHANEFGEQILAKIVLAFLSVGVPTEFKGFTWPSQIPADCPFPRSKAFSGLFFTGKFSDYRVADTWYPSWASDGNLYSPFTDGSVGGVPSSSGKGALAETGHAVMMGDDPLRLIISNTSMPKIASALPYGGRYPAGSLVHNGIWYYGTYCLGPTGEFDHNGFSWNWPNLGPMPGFQISRDYGKTWQDSPHTPEKPLFPEPSVFLGPVKMGAPHFVDFGKNMEHSPDGKAYLLGMGALENDPKPRPCVRHGAPGEGVVVVPGCTNGFAHGNLSWISADQIYLARVTPSPETINNLNAYEFFAGLDAVGKPVWTDRFDCMKPLLEWNNRMGCVTATYVPGLKKYLMCVTDGWPTNERMDSYILESDSITGPWRIVTYMKDFGEQAYFLNFPSKFISTDGQTLWLCYSANFSRGWSGVELKFNPPGGRYGLCLFETTLVKP